MIPAILLLGVVIFVNTFILGANVLALSCVLVIIAYKYERKKTKWDTLIFIVSFTLAILTLFVDMSYISSGLIGFAMFNVVMFTGVLPNQWSLTKKLRLHRDMYSILGVIYILPHVYMNLFVDKQINLFFGIAGFVIMLPLFFLTSFSIIKKEMKTREWVKLQKAAYIVYPLLFAHLISVADWYGKIIYAVLLTLYINNKLIKEFRK